MPTNLPPEAAEAERQYRSAKSVTDKITHLEEFIKLIPKHKGTDKLRGSLRKRLSKLRNAAQGQKKISRQDSVFLIDKEGAGQVAIVGPPNVGKSALVAALTNATPEVAIYPFSTWTPTPGMMMMENVQFQLIDTPPLNREYMEPALIDLIKRSDLILLVIDLQANPIHQTEDTIALLEEYRIVPRYLQDSYTKKQRVTFKPLLVLANKNDNEDLDEDFEVLRELFEDNMPMIPISATTGRYFDWLNRALLEQLEIMRVYSKPPGKEANFNSPFVLKNGSTIEEFAAKVHQDFFKQLKLARIWGIGVYDGQMVGRDHILHDGDVVELRM